MLASHSGVFRRFPNCLSEDKFFNKIQLMRRIIQLAAFGLAVFLVTPLAAQVTVSPKVGINFSGIDGDIKDFRTNSRIGWNAGLDLRLGQGTLFFKPGLHYYNFTAGLQKESSLPDNFELEDKTTIQAFKAPVNLGINLTGKDGIIRLHAHGGVVPTYVFNVKERADFDLSKDDLHPWSFGANAGLGIDFLIFTADLNYEFGLSEFFKASDEKPNVLTASVGLRF